MPKRFAAAILGGTGYGAGELLRLLAVHPDVEPICVVSSSHAGEPLFRAHPQLRGVYGLNFDSTPAFDALASYEKSVIFSALPHGVTAKTVAGLMPEIEARNVLLVDLSGDFRLGERDIRERFYPETSEVAELQKKFVFGLPELFRKEISSATAIASPGCFSTACSLSVAPLASGAFRGEIIFDAKTGSSGAGRSAQDAFHHPKRHGNFAAYKMLNHRHEPEILQALGDPRGQRIQSAFVPHLLPTVRGIFVTAYLTLPQTVSATGLREIYSEFYRGSPFVRLVDESPELQSVIGSNFCDIGLAVRDKQVVVMAAIDNLVKGMAGQAIQSMNLRFGLPETTGLLFPGFGPT